MRGTLMELTSEIMALEHALMESDGVLSPEMEELLNLATGNLREKVDRYKHVMDAFEARANYFADMAKGATQAKKLFENQRDRLKGLMKEAIRLSGSSEFEGNDWRFVLSRAKEKLIINEDELPPEYFKERIVKEPDRDLIEDMVRCGFPIPGVSVEPSESLRPYVNPVGRAREVKEGDNGAAESKPRGGRQKNKPDSGHLPGPQSSDATNDGGREGAKE